MKPVKVGAYYYPGWHPCPVRNASFPKGWSEWDLIGTCKPRFPGHDQPKEPLWGFEDETDPDVFAKKISTANKYGIDFFCFVYYWSRGKRLLEDALNEGFLKAKNKNDLKFALMWGNRMPRKVMPVKDPDARLVDPSRLVYTDPNDFLEFIDFLGNKYFGLKNYLRIDGACYLSIFDTTFFLRQMGTEFAQKAIVKARKILQQKGLTLHLAAIDPILQHQEALKQIGFDSVTHYVFLPEWKGAYQQDFSEAMNKKAQLWNNYQTNTALPYVPSITPGWDANPRGVDYGKEKEGRYPWSPIIINNNPETFAQFAQKAAYFAKNVSKFPEPMYMVSSWNEWTEGHYLEPDKKHGFKWLEAIKANK